MRDDYRECEVCKTEFRVQRDAQAYCSPRCRREAAYGRERFQSETKGPRKRYLRPGEASDASLLEAATVPEIPPARGVAGSFLKQHFSFLKSTTCRAVFPIDILGGRGRGRGLLDPEIRERILWCEVAAPSTGIDTMSRTGKLIMGILALIAEFENDIRRERQQDGINKAKAEGVRFGPKPLLTADVVKKTKQLRKDGLTVPEIMRRMKLSKASVYRALA
jgi:hypothetical protein